MERGQSKVAKAARFPAPSKDCAVFDAIAAFDVELRQGLDRAANFLKIQGVRWRCSRAPSQRKKGSGWRLP
jgi:hypothetical protein